MQDGKNAGDLADLIFGVHPWVGGPLEAMRNKNFKSTRYHRLFLRKEGKGVFATKRANFNSYFDP